MEIQELITHALRAREKAIAPYSKFQVGSVVVMKSGKIFSGCNIEISSYSLTLCAERTALFKALSEGERGVTDVCVIADTESPCYPCGACRQVLWDFASEARIVCANLKGRYEIYKMKDLIPHAFGQDDLK